MFAGENRTEEYKKHNPFGKVPVLIDGDSSIWDSHAICIYLVEKYAKNDDLYPKDLKKRTKVNQMLFFEASHLFQRFYEIAVPIYFGMNKIAPQHKVVEVNMTYEIMEKFFSGENSYVCGDFMSIADLSIWSTILSFRYLVPIDGEKYPRLDGWLKLMNSRETYEENQKGANDHIALFERCINGNPMKKPPFWKE